MTSATPATEIETRLRAQWTETPVFVANQQFTPPVDGEGKPLKHVVLEFPGAAAQQWSIGDPGNNVWREDGAFQLHACVPAGETAADAKEMVDDLAVIFRGKSFGGVVCMECNPPVATESPNGLWYRESFTTRYHYQYLA